MRIDQALLNLLGRALGDAAPWASWLAVLKAFQGVPLTPIERDFFLSVSGGREPPAAAMSELWCVIGRRSGKSRMASAARQYRDFNSRGQSSEQAAEWDAEFRSDISAFFDSNVIEAAIDYERPLELPPRRNTAYFAFIDPTGGGRDYYSCCIGHTQKDRFTSWEKPGSGPKTSLASLRRCCGFMALRK
jgi:hypothetical protein